MTYKFVALHVLAPLDGFPAHIEILIVWSARLPIRHSWSTQLVFLHMLAQSGWNSSLHWCWTHDNFIFVSTGWCAGTVTMIVFSHEVAQIITVPRIWLILMCTLGFCVLWCFFLIGPISFLVMTLCIRLYQVLAAMLAQPVQCALLFLTRYVTLS